MAHVAYLPASTMCAKIDVVEGKRGHPAFLIERSGPMLVKTSYGGTIYFVEQCAN